MPALADLAPDTLPGGPEDLGLGQPEVDLIFGGLTRQLQALSSGEVILTSDAVPEREGGAMQSSDPADRIYDFQANGDQEGNGGSKPNGEGSGGGSGKPHLPSREEFIPDRKNGGGKGGGGKGK